MTSTGHWVGPTNGSYTITYDPTSAVTALPVGNVSYEPDAGQQTNIKLGLKKDISGEISAKLYFSYVKSKMTKIQKEKLSARINKLKKLVVNAKELEQLAPYEEFSKMLAIVVRESEAYAMGITKYIDKPIIDKFLHKVKDKPIRFSEFDKFPRLLPMQVKKIYMGIRDRKLFDQYYILYTDYTGEVQLKTNKEKIKEKDPILFGCYAYQPNRFYVLADWVDEYCDITLDTFVDKIKEDDPTFGVSETPDLNDKAIEDIKKAVLARSTRLTNTKPSNYKDLMKEEDKTLNKKPGFFKRLFRKKNTL